jgi:hypothetical protein
VRGAQGDVALEVIRPGGDDTIRVGRSQFESAGNPAPHGFETSLPVERGDLLGVSLAEGAQIGITETTGATTQRWLATLGGFYGSPDREEGTGFDFEVALRADFVPGAELEPPEQLKGAQAANAPDGTVRKRAAVEISKPRSIANVELVEVGNRVALDLVRDGRRLARMFVPGAVPGGDIGDLKFFSFEGESFSEIAVFWVNPNTGRLIQHFYTVSAREIEFSS